VAITSISEVDLRKPFFGYDGDVWEVQSYCSQPTVTMVNRRTGVTIGGAVGCRNLAKFVPITQGCPDGLLSIADERSGDE